MITSLLPKKPKRDYTEKQVAFLDAIVSNGGDIGKALEIAGYSPNSRNSVISSLREELIENANQVLATHSIKAASHLVNTMDDGEGEMPRAEVRLKAAESILNRVGIGRRDTVEHNVTAIHGVVLLPSKDTQQEPLIINQES